MNNRETINTYEVTGKLHVDFDSISKVTQYHLDRIYEDRINVKYLLDLVVDKVINFKTFATLGASILVNLGEFHGCESIVCSVANAIRKINRYVDKSHLDWIITNMIYEMSINKCSYTDMKKILKRACIVDLSENEYIHLNNKKALVSDIGRSSDSLNYFELEGYEDHIAMIVVNRSNIEVYTANDIKSKLDKIVLLSNMIVDDDFDIWLQAKNEDEKSLINDILDSKLFR